MPGMSSTGGSGFEIVNRLSGQCLDIWSESPGALLQWPCYGGFGQRWEFTTADQGGASRSIANVLSGLVIDQAGATNTRGGAVLQWLPAPGAANQRLTVSPAPTGTTTPTPTPTSTPTPTPVPTGWLSLSFVHSGQAMSVSEASREPGAAIVQWPFALDDTHSQWKLVPQGERGFEIVNRASGQCLDIWDENPGALLQWPCYGGLGQRWEFVEVAPGAFYSVVRNVLSGLAINQAGPTTAPGGAVIQWYEMPGDNERLVITPIPQRPHLDGRPGSGSTATRR